MGEDVFSSKLSQAMYAVHRICEVLRQQCGWSRPSTQCGAWNTLGGRCGRESVISAVLPVVGGLELGSVGLRAMIERCSSIGSCVHARVGCDGFRSLVHCSQEDDGHVADSDCFWANEQKDPEVPEA